MDTGGPRVELIHDPARNDGSGLSMDMETVNTYKGQSEILSQLNNDFQEGRDSYYTKKQADRLKKPYYEYVEKNVMPVHVATDVQLLNSNFELHNKPPADKRVILLMKEKPLAANLYEVFAEAFEATTQTRTFCPGYTMQGPYGRYGNVNIFQGQKIPLYKRYIPEKNYIIKLDAIEVRSAVNEIRTARDVAFNNHVMTYMTSDLFKRTLFHLKPFNLIADYCKVYENRLAKYNAAIYAQTDIYKDF